MILAAIVGLVVAAAGRAGFALHPDTDLYSRRGVHLWPSPLGSFAGTIAGRPGVIAMSAIAAAACVLLVRRRRLFAIGSLYWLLFPGVDALGAVFVLIAYRARRRRTRAGWLGVAALAHPVAAIVAAPITSGSSRRPELAACAGLTVATIVAVGLLDGFSTTDRYLLPLVGMVTA